MCLSGLFPKPPTPQPIPRTPQPDSDMAMRRTDEIRRLAMERSGSAANLVSDLQPSDIASARPVLKPATAVYLGS